MSGNKNIKDFFKPSQPASSPTVLVQETERSESSLSPPPTSEPFLSSPLTPTKRDVQLPTSQHGPSRMEIQASDDEGENSDSSLEDLATLLAWKSSDTKSTHATSQKIPSTPIRSSKYQKRDTHGFHKSPMTVLPKYRFDLSSLVNQAEKDDAAQASSNRVKEMLSKQKTTEMSGATNSEIPSPEKLANCSILQSVVSEVEDGGAHRVARALMRTEATVTERRWYFFETGSSPYRPESRSFPASYLSRDWQQLKDPKTRYQTFVSGFAEDMVVLGRKLPDEIFLWLFHDLCVMPANPLRACYINVLAVSTEQVERLVTPLIIKQMFRRIGASESATTVGEQLRPSPKVPNPYPKRDWAILLSIIKLLGEISKSLTPLARTHALVMLLRLSADQLILDNVDLLVSIQETLQELCLHSSAAEWDPLCKDVCSMLFTCVELSSLRQQLVDCISSTMPRTHDLRQRLAMCFFFDDISYSLQHSHDLVDIEKFMDRLATPMFHTNSKTDYQELSSLISLLDIAIDDGRSSKIDLRDKATETKFNRDVDELCVMIKDIMKNVGTLSAAFASRMRAKDAVDLVSGRIMDTIRTKPKPREGWFDRPRGRQEEDFGEEKKGLASFVSKMGRITDGSVAKNINDRVQ